MNKVTFLLLLSGLTACREPDLTQQAIAALPLRLKSRLDSRVNAYNYTHQENTATYQYNAANQVVRIDRDWLDRTVTYQYQAGRLTTRLTQSAPNGPAVFEDRFSYNALGQMVRKVALVDGAWSVYDYRYNDAGQLVEVEQRAQAYRYYNRTRYDWQNGNVVYQTEFGENGQKRSEWSYTYDRKVNPYRLSPYNPDDVFQFTANNRVVSRLARDYTGLIDLGVNPVRYRYEYDPIHLPASVAINNGLTQVFTYEAKP